MPGSGKSVVARKLAENFGCEYFDAGQIRREIAKRHNMTLDELNEVGKTEFWTDKECDDEIVKIGREKQNLIFVGRIAYYFIPDSVKIFLSCDLEVAARRIMADDSRGSESYENLAKAVEKLGNRIQADSERYKKYYDVDYQDPTNFDLILDTTELSIEEVMQAIKDFLKKGNSD